MEDEPIRVGISCGDLNGIGLEVVLKTFNEPRMLQGITPVLYCGAKAVSQLRRVLGGMAQLPVNGISAAAEALPKKLNVVHVWADEAPMALGEDGGKVAPYAIQSLEAAAHDLSAGKVDVLVTAPIDKHAMQQAGFAHAGHTEFLAQMAGGQTEVLMLLVNEGLRVGTVTGHIPLHEVAGAITTEAILAKARVLRHSLEQDFGLDGPRIAILGLNPHAGDRGSLGSEERDRIIPAIQTLNDEGITALGPFPADGFFGHGDHAHFDGILAMYHDQGLIPFKTLSFGQGVNYTAGLPIVRTSPDHGTAHGIAGQGVAMEGSFRHAVWLACDILRHRRNYKEMTADPLQVQPESKARKEDH